jgi:phytoene desaturase
MPDVFERYFARFGKKPSNYYALKRLDPSYRIYFGPGDFMDIPATMDKLSALFESLEPGSSRHLKTFLEEGKFKYEIGMNSLVYKPGLSLLEFADSEVITGALKLHLFQSITSYLRKFFHNDRILKLLEFPVLFLGATAAKTPALYSLMNYADITLGTWYPKGGMYSIVAGMEKLAIEQGVKFRYNSAVQEIPVERGKATGVVVDDTLIPFDYVIAGADYHHVEQQLLPEKYRRYSPSYWDKRVMAPSSLLFYVGLNKRITGLLHHTLFFDEDFTQHSREIYEEPQWPAAPQFYVSCASATDDTIAPGGHENLVILIPVAPGLTDTEATREKYYEMVMKRLEKITGQAITQHVVYKRSYAHNDFQADYNAFKGNAYGLANTLLQTAILKPSIVNKKVSNLLYTGQLTVPGPGVPPSLISGQVVADQILAREKKDRKV